MEIFQLRAFSDNYIYVLKGSGSGSAGGGAVAVVDAGDAGPVNDFLAERGWRLTHILNTHHHRDHVGANLALKEKHGCRILGASRDSARIPGVDQGFGDGDRFSLFGEEVRVMEVDGHTRGHIAFYLPASRALFSGDTIFSLGCGKLFEGTAREMWNSLAKLRALPADTLVHGAHEYTLENSVFALRAEPGNRALRDRVARVEALRARDEATVPTSLAEECACNPFLRPESEELRAYVGLPEAESWQVFGALREAKDRLDAGG